MIPVSSTLIAPFNPSQTKLMRYQAPSGMTITSQSALYNLKAGLLVHKRLPNIEIPVEITYYSISNKLFGNDHEFTNAGVNNLIALYEAWNKPEKAEQWRSKLPQTETAEQ